MGAGGGGVTDGGDGFGGITSWYCGLDEPLVPVGARGTERTGVNVVSLLDFDACSL